MITGRERESHGMAMSRIKNGLFSVKEVRLFFIFGNTILTLIFILDANKSFIFENVTF